MSKSSRRSRFRSDTPTPPTAYLDTSIHTHPSVSPSSKAGFVVGCFGAYIIKSEDKRQRRTHAPPFMREIPKSARVQQRRTPSFSLRWGGAPNPKPIHNTSSASSYLPESSSTSSSQQDTHTSGSKTPCLVSDMNIPHTELPMSRTFYGRLFPSDTIDLLAARLRELLRAREAAMGGEHGSRIDCEYEVRDFSEC